MPRRSAMPASLSGSSPPAGRRRNVGPMNRPPQASEIVAAVGRALYGIEWVAQMAAELDVNVRTLQRIKASALKGEEHPWAGALVADLDQAFAARLAAFEE